MEIEQITNYFNKHKSEIVKKLSANEWRHFRDYFLIKEKFSNNVLDNDFKNVFCAFYVMNGPMGLNNAQKNEFFKLLSLRENILEKILKSLYEIPSYGQRHRLFLSFGTKLLHTIDNNLPIYDRNIAYALKLTSQSTGTLEAKIKNRIDIYNELKNNFDLLLKNPEIISCLKDIRQEIYEATIADRFEWKDNFVSDTKLLDSSLWALYDSLMARKVSM